MLSRSLCVMTALLAIPGMVIGLIFMLCWAVRTGVVRTLAHMRGESLPVRREMADELEFPALWRE
ncbi:hypothetical protein [Silvibacterium dinghuense]|uniref:Uncharacterized protein n=1 Tax=Silvibacterium dinghuense TaxID=1560006 RepID=A0A4Q1SK54_9BACT|nr:hypothetical protein [Silvibacterium dinghuense]RXS97833.1 hypothetical protein ESZ00_08225 [Silvibacterium dinghuense]